MDLGKYLFDDAILIRYTYIFAKGLKQERRASRMLVPDLFWMWQGDNLILRFSLASGYFATSILQELGDIQEAPREYFNGQEVGQVEKEGEG